MSKIRSDDNLIVFFRRENGQWTTFTVEWKDQLTDGVYVFEKPRREEYNIADLPPSVKIALQDAWNGMKDLRDANTPL